MNLHWVTLSPTRDDIYILSLVQLTIEICSLGHTALSTHTALCKLFKSALTKSTCPHLFDSCYLILPLYLHVISSSHSIFMAWNEVLWDLWNSNTHTHISVHHQYYHLPLPSTKDHLCLSQWNLVALYRAVSVCSVCLCLYLLFDEWFSPSPSLLPLQIWMVWALVVSLKHHKCKSSTPITKLHPHHLAPLIKTTPTLGIIQWVSLIAMYCN